MLYHQCCEFTAIDEHDALFNHGHEITGVFTETGGGNKPPFTGAVHIECTGKRLDVWPTDCVVAVALGLQVDGIEPELIVFDDAINTAIVSVLSRLSKIPLIIATFSSIQWINSSVRSWWRA